MHVCIIMGLAIAYITQILAEHLFECLSVSPNLKPVKSERSNFTQVLSEFRVPKNSFHGLPLVLKTYFES